MAVSSRELRVWFVGGLSFHDLCVSTSMRLIFLISLMLLAAGTSVSQTADPNGGVFTTDGLVLWLDPSDGDTVLDASGNSVNSNLFVGGVQTILDKSGNGNNLSVSSSSRPELSTLNGLNSVRFTNDLMKAPALFGAAFSEMHFFMISNKTNGGQTEFVSFKDGAGGNDRATLLIPYFDGTGYYWDAGSTTTQRVLVNAPGIAMGDIFQLSAYKTVTGNQNGISLNNGQYSATRTGAAPALAGQFTVGTKTADKHFGEALVFNRKLSPAEADQVERYLMSKWIYLDHRDLVTQMTRVSADELPAEGDTVTFRITVANETPGTVATNVALVAQLPEGLTYVSHLESVGSYDGVSGIWSLGDVTNGMPVTLDVSATVDVGQAGATITYTTSVASGGKLDLSTEGDDLTEAIEIFLPQPELVLEKSFSLLTDVNGDGRAGFGDIIRYFYTVTNSGNVAIEGVVVSNQTNGHDPAFLGGVDTGNPVSVSVTTDQDPLGDSFDLDNAGPVWDQIGPGDVITFTADYAVQQEDVDYLQ